MSSLANQVIPIIIGATISSILLGLLLKRLSSVGTQNRISIINNRKLFSCFIPFGFLLMLPLFAWSYLTIDILSQNIFLLSVAFLTAIAFGYLVLGGNEVREG